LLADSGLTFRLLHLRWRLPLRESSPTAWLKARRAARSGPSHRVERPQIRALARGYLSADFGRHPVGFLTRSMYRLHDRERFEVFGYALAGDDGSANFRTISETCDVFVDVRTLPAGQLAARIAADSIDILVDLNGYTRNGRSHLFALRPAPVQLNYLGYPATLGGKLADYSSPTLQLCRRRWSRLCREDRPAAAHVSARFASQPSRVADADAEPGTATRARVRLLRVS